jgi:hypothetical protein
MGENRVELFRRKGRDCGRWKVYKRTQTSYGEWAQYPRSHSQLYGTTYP